MTDAQRTEVVLRKVVESDLPTFFAHQANPAATRMAAFTARDEDAFMAHWRKTLAEPTGVARTVVLDGDVAGYVVSWERQEGREIGSWIGEEFWGKGVATRAVAAFLDEDATRPLYAHVVKHNAASIRVLQKCGFSAAGEATRPPDEHGEALVELILVLAAGEPRR